MWIRGLGKFPNGRDWLCGKLGLALVGRAMLSESFIQLPADGGACAPSMYFGLRWPILESAVSVFGLVVTSSRRMYFNMLHLLGMLLPVPWPHGRPLSTRTSAGDSWTLTSKSNSVSCGVTDPFSWVLVHTRFCLCPPRVSVSPVLWKFCNQIPLTFKVRFPGDSQSQVPLDFLLMSMGGLSDISYSTFIRSGIPLRLGGRIIK